MILSLPDAIAQILEKHLAKEQASLSLEFKTADQPKLENIESVASIASDVNADQAVANGLTPKIKSPSIADLGEAPACPECGGMLDLGEGCLKCNFCGYSKCS